MTCQDVTGVDSYVSWVVQNTVGQDESVGRKTGVVALFPSVYRVSHGQGQEGNGRVKRPARYFSISDLHKYS
jgi:hypothetical protein